MDCISLEKKKQVVNYFLQRNTLLGNDFISKVSENFKEDQLFRWLSQSINENNLFFLNNEVIDLLNDGKTDILWKEFEKSKVLQEKGYIQDSVKTLIEKNGVSSLMGVCRPGIPCVNILFSYDEDAKKKEVNDFVYLFNKRYESIRKILMNRQELMNATSISRLIGKKDKSACSLIGNVLEKSITSNNNIMLTLEDQTGTIKVFAGQNKSDLYKAAKELVLDEVIGVVGTNGDNIVFANSIVLPDVPMHNEIKKAPDESYAAFLSDLHVGSDTFLPEEFNKFLSWIKGESGNDSQKELASKVDYIFIIGDLVDGVGIYPEQDKELIIKDIYQQYDECARLLKEIPEHIKIIICPGNHDALRISEPQPCLSKEYARSLWQLKNVVMVSNPSLVNIHSSEGFPGFDILLYHGYSFDYYVANVDTIREKGGYDRADLIMKFLLQRRHLAPAYTSTLYVADPLRDCLVMEKVPDFFVTGHIHKSYVANYKNITMICGSCWQSTTNFQEKVGHSPEPARVPLVNLKTRKV
ncbi:MAG: DNA-directed DNA polymerase II small subunit, partial [Nanoarchaeota archaeon]|nr:DNA-directed DNA polymerase II small subunit [Nanoarchaeota archaeon]